MPLQYGNTHCKKPHLLPSNFAHFCYFISSFAFQGQFVTICVLNKKKVFQAISFNNKKIAFLSWPCFRSIYLQFEANWVLIFIAILNIFNRGILWLVSKILSSNIFLHCVILSYENTDIFNMPIRHIWNAHRKEMTFKIYYQAAL